MTKKGPVAKVSANFKSNKRYSPKSEMSPLDLKITHTIEKKPRKTNPNKLTQCSHVLCHSSDGSRTEI